MLQIGPDLQRRRQFSLPDTFSKTSQFQHLEGYGDGHMFIQEVLEQAQAKLEQAQITTICAVNDNDPVLKYGQRAQEKVSIRYRLLYQ